MKRLLIITDTWTPQVNGVVTVTKKTVELLPKYGYEVVVIHPGMFWSMQAPAYKDLRLSIVSRRTIRSLIRSHAPDAIHIATEGVLGALTRSVCMADGIPFTTAYHTHFPLYVRAWLGFLVTPTYAYLRWFHSASKRVLVSTTMLKDTLATHGFDRLVVCPLGVDTELFKPTHAQTTDSTQPVFVYCGRVSKEKNIEEFLTAPLPGTKLVIGDGAQRAYFEHKYPTVQFVGYKFGTELVEMISRASVLVFPSRTDTFGLIIIEALACGTPVAAHPVLGPQELLTEGVTGALDADLTQAALRCLTLSRAACREAALAYSWDTAIQTFASSLEQIPTH